MQQCEESLMELSSLTRELHLRAIHNKCEEYQRIAMEENWSYEHFLRTVLQAEYEQRLSNSQLKRLKTAGFPQFKYMEDLNRDELPAGLKPLLPELETGLAA